MHPERTWDLSQAGRREQSSGRWMVEEEEENRIRSTLLICPDFPSLQSRPFLFLKQIYICVFSCWPRNQALRGSGHGFRLDGSKQI